MANLPPPPVVGRGTRSSDAADADRAAAQAELPSAVMASPDDWLLEAEAAAPVPAAGPAIAVTPHDDRPATDAIDLIDASDLVDEATDAAPPLVPPTPVRATAPVTPASSGATPRTSTTRVDPPTSHGDRRTLFAVAGILGTALVAVLIARCGGDTASATTDRGTIAGARVEGGARPPSTVAEARGQTPDTSAGADGAAGTPTAAVAPSEAPAPSDPAGTPSAAAAPSDAAPSDAPAPVAAAAPSDAAPSDGEPTLVEPAAGAAPKPSDAAVPASTTKAASRPSARTDTASTAGTTSTEPPMTAAESLEKARTAWKAGDAKNTYKFANKSRFKEPTPEATELATLAACKMKLDDAAKSSFKQLSGDRKKHTRTACRDFGVRVGL